MGHDGDMVGVVVSVNRAESARTDVWTQVKSGRSGIDKRPAAGPVLLGAGGVAGDTICDTRHHGGPDRAVYAYAAEDLAYWSAELGLELVAGNAGENLTLSGVDCSGAVVGERWQVGDALLRVTGPRAPCGVFAGFLGVPDLVRRFLHAGRPGAYLAVDRSAEVAAGDPVAILDRPAHGVTVADLLAVRAGRRERLDHVVRARSDLGADAREWLDRVVGVGER
jgi:MOSC domain-containing protein YiiM